MARQLRMALASALLAVLASGFVVATAATPAMAGTEQDTTHESDTPTGPVVLIGVTGLQWDDVSALTTPSLWLLSRDAGVGQVSARSVATRACPADGWLAVSAGSRAADSRPDGTCRTLFEPIQGPDGDEVRGWDEYLEAISGQPYDARPGLLGDAVAQAQIPASSFGPGAAIALADSQGFVVGDHNSISTTSELTTQIRAALLTSQLIVVDAGTIREAGAATETRGPPVNEPSASTDPLADPAQDPDVDPSVTATLSEPTRLEQVRRADSRIGAVLDAVTATSSAQDATVLVVSLADSGRAELQLAAALGPAPDGHRYDAAALTSGSTQQWGLIQTLDVTPTLMSSLGLDGPALPGADIVPTPGPPTAIGRLDRLASISAEAITATKVSSGFTTWVALSQAVLFLAAALLLQLRRAPCVTLRILKVAALLLGSMPIASFLAGTVPWWSISAYRAAFWVTVFTWMVAITTLALAGPWRHRPLGPAGVVATITVVVLLVDLATGSNLIIDAPMGAQRILAARFYGASNQAFALLVAAGILVAVMVADALLQRGRRNLATASVLGIGAVLAVVDGAPGLGSDVGGPASIVLAFALLAVAVSGRKISWRWVLLVLLVAGLVVGSFMVADYLRPPDDRTHLGRFLATVVDGGMGTVLYRKLVVNLRVLTNWRYLLLAVAGMVLAWVVVVGPRPRRGRIGASGAGGALDGLSDSVPLLRTGYAAIGVALGLAFLVNDSGIVIPATGIAVAVPCLVAAAAQWRQTASCREAPVDGRSSLPHPEPAVR